MKIIYAINGDSIMVSDCDWLFLCGYRWSLNSWGYYCCTSKEIWKGQQIHSMPIHWFVAKLMNLNISNNFQIDHIDRDKSNNQRSNLRVVSRSLQMFNQNKRKDNRSGFIGVGFKSGQFRSKPWRARIKLPTGEYRFLGYFATPEEASEAYQAAKKIRDEKEIDRCSILTQKQLGSTDSQF